MSYCAIAVQYNYLVLSIHHSSHYSFNSDRLVFANWPSLYLAQLAPRSLLTPYQTAIGDFDKFLCVCIGVCSHRRNVCDVCSPRLPRPVSRRGTVQHR